MSPNGVELIAVLANAGEPPRQFQVDPRCARIAVGGLLVLDHLRNSPDGVPCQCREVGR